MLTRVSARRLLGLCFVSAAALLAAGVVDAVALAQHGTAGAVVASHATNSSNSNSNSGSVDGWAGQLVAQATDNGRIMACLDADGLPKYAVTVNCPGTLHYLYVDGASNSSYIKSPSGYCGGDRKFGCGSGLWTASDHPTLSVPISRELGGLVTFRRNTASATTAAPPYYMLMRQYDGMALSALYAQHSATRAELEAAHPRTVVFAGLQLLWLPASSSVWNATIKAPIRAQGAHASKSGPPTAAN